MARHPKKQVRSRKVTKQEVYSAIYKSKKHRVKAKKAVLKGGNWQLEQQRRLQQLQQQQYLQQQRRFQQYDPRYQFQQQYLAQQQQPTYQPQTTPTQYFKPQQQQSARPSYGKGGVGAEKSRFKVVTAAKIKGMEIAHKVKTAGREIAYGLKINKKEILRLLKDLKNAYSLFRLMSVKLDDESNKLIQYYKSSIMGKLLSPISEGTVSGSIFSKKATQPIITVTESSMSTPLINRYLYRLANIRDIPTVSFTDRCNMGSIKRYAAKFRNVVTLKGIRKHTVSKMANFDRYGEPQFKFLVCRIYNYRMDEIAYNNAYQNLVMVIKQILNNTYVRNRIKTPSDMYTTSKFNHIEYLDVSSKPSEKLDANVDILLNRLNQHLTKDEPKMDKSADFIASNILKHLQPSEKVTEPITWILTNALSIAKRVDTTRKLMYKVTYIRPTDELTYMPTEYENWFLPSTAKVNKASDRISFIRELNQMNAGIQQFVNLITPGIERLLKTEAKTPDSDLIQQKIKALEYAYKYYAAPERQSIDAIKAIETLHAASGETPEFLFGSKPTLGSLLEMIRVRINELKGFPEPATKSVPILNLSNVPPANELNLSRDSSMAATPASPVSVSSIGSSQPSRPRSASVSSMAVPAPVPSLNSSPRPRSMSTGSMTTRQAGPTHQNAARALGGMSPSPNIRTAFTGGAVFSRYYKDVTPGSDMQRQLDYKVLQSDSGYDYIQITEPGLLKIYSKILYLLQRPYFIPTKTAGERLGMVKRGNKPFESVFFKTAYYNYIVKMDMGITEYNTKRTPIPVKFPDTTMYNNLPGFVSTYLYSSFYALSDNINYSDLNLIDLRVLDELNREESKTTSIHKYSHKHHVYLKSDNNRNKDKLQELFGEASSQGDYVTIPPSFLQYALLAPEELVKLLELDPTRLHESDNLGELRDRVNTGSLNPGKMEDLKILMDDAGTKIIRELYTRLKWYIANSQVINIHSQDDAALRTAFDNCLSKIILFLKLNHLYGDFIRFKKLDEEAEEEPTHANNYTVDDIIANEDLPVNSKALLLLIIGQKDDINTLADISAIISEVMKPSIETEAKPEEAVEEELVLGSSAPRTSTTETAVVSSTTPVKPLTKAVNQDIYCVYKITKLDISKNEIEVSLTDHANILVDKILPLNEHDIITLPLTNDSRIYPLTRTDDKLPYIRGLPTNITTDQIQLEEPSKSGNYIVISSKRKSECNPKYTTLVKQINSYKFSEPSGIANKVRIITHNIELLPKLAIMPASLTNTSPK